MQIEQQLIVAREPNSLVTESFRSLRASLTRSLMAGKRCFAIVSSWGGEGKSMISANLAVCLTQLHMHVVLVDGDIRRPTLTRLFDLDQSSGFTDWLEAGGNPRDFVVETKFPRLSVLPAGRSTESPANLLGRGGVQKVFDALREGDRCVIVDTSPLSTCSDPLLLSAHCDGALLVVNPRTWEGEPEVRFKHALEDHGVELLGVILNGADHKEQPHGTKYGYGYGYGHVYGGEGGPESPGKKERGGWLGWFRRKSRKARKP